MPSSSGNSSEQARPGRDRTRTLEPSWRTWARIPSNLTSSAHPSSSGARPLVASIGSTNRGSSSRGARVTAPTLREELLTPSQKNVPLQEAVTCRVGRWSATGDGPLQR